jgi:hypothetical protein
MIRTVATLCVPLALVGCSTASEDSATTEQAGTGIDAPSSCADADTARFAATLASAGFRQTETLRQQVVYDRVGNNLYWRDVSAYRFEHADGRIQYATCKGIVGPDVPLKQASSISGVWTRGQTTIGEGKARFETVDFRMGGIVGWDGYLTVNVQAKSPTDGCDTECAGPSVAQRLQLRPEGPRTFSSDDARQRLFVDARGRVKAAHLLVDDQAFDAGAFKGPPAIPIVVRIVDVGQAEDIQALPSSSIRLPLSGAPILVRNESSFDLTFSGAANPGQGWLFAKSDTVDSLTFAVVPGDFLDFVPYPGRRLEVSFDTP